MIREWILKPVLQKLNEIKEAINMATQADLDSAIKTLSDLITSEDAGIAALVAQVTALIAKVQGGTPAADLATEVQAIQSLASDITNQSATLASSVAAAKPVTGA